MVRLFTQLIAILICLGSFAFAQEKTDPKVMLANMSSVAFTSGLPDVDRIELFLLGNPDDEKEKKRRDPALKEEIVLHEYDDGSEYLATLSAHKTLKGDHVKEIVAAWKAMTFKPNGAFCHVPPYAIRFYKDDKLVFETTACWKCHNFRFPVYDAESGKVSMELFGFKDNGHSKKLLALLQKHLPIPKPEKKVGSKLED